MSKRLPPVLLILVLAGCGGGGKQTIPYKPAPKPTLKALGAVAPSPCSSDNHTMGQCLPKPAQALGLSPRQGVEGCDLSNNDPIYGSVAWSQIARRMSWCYFKVTEGVGFVDSTAGPMARAAKGQHLAVGGYSFQHICLDSPVAEADLFSRYLRASGLLEKGTLPPMADAEYGPRSCDARAWENAWRSRMIHDTGVNPGMYTGAWYADPEFGCWWPSPVHGHVVLSWFASYGYSPVRSCGHSEVDVWQNSDHGYNGYNFTDHSVWYAGKDSLGRAINGGQPKPKPRYHCLKPHSRFYGSRKCQGVRNSLKRWRGAVGASQHASRHFGCPHPPKKFRKVHCRTFSGRIRFYQNLINQTQRRYA